MAKLHGSVWLIAGGIITVTSIILGFIKNVPNAAFFRLMVYIGGFMLLIGFIKIKLTKKLDKLENKTVHTGPQGYNSPHNTNSQQTHHNSNHTQRTQATHQTQHANSSNIHPANQQKQQQTSSPQTQQTQAKYSRFCHQCRAPLLKHHKFCPLCGAQV